MGQTMLYAYRDRYIDDLCVREELDESIVLRRDTTSGKDNSHSEASLAG